MGPVRSELMWQAVADAVTMAGGSSLLDVLDLGGGTGGDAVRLAQSGHRVTVVDPSPDALASLHRRGVEAGLAVPVTGVQGDASDLPAHVAPASFDLVMCHGVLEHVDDPGEALDTVATVLRPGGHVSVMVAGRNAAVAARALAGDFVTAQTLLGRTAADWDLRSMGPRRFVVAEVEQLLVERGFQPVESSGVRVFADLVPSAIVDTEPGAREALFALERILRTSSDFTGFSAGLHTIARLDLNSAPSDPGGNSATL
ncbi:class I SAM-dependent methyltransferase [Aeromicrobium wangtongii]|uniref:Methyltransferase domain-containing protein n=1 Tax=Aeromicrobium wangtongii TaxID=2969247 RepID=A0ABY5MA67_9ACTN|nr:class I SAM-dependent methyltransferase [Aeromicrobium wangtongii]MCD9197539.1 methyltransferase domain-containing protein [Aeromicrobium wangtongii]UUP15030.1 methyltransferase domain-containing protein [Aeromicrobium wangtongii]